MHIDVIFSPLEVSRCNNIDRKTVIVIDVLRASSTMVYAFNGYDNGNIDILKGVKSIIPAKDIESAFDIYNSLKSKKGYLLAGERNCLPPEGFHLCNSPLNYTVKKIRGKSLVMATTNGTRMIDLFINSKCILIGSFLNAFVVAYRAIKNENDIIIGCAGREDVSGLEDITCAGLITKYIKDLALETGKKVELSDSAILASKSYYNFDSTIDILKNSFHGKSLLKLGYEEDIIACSLKNKFNIIPSYKNGQITAEVINFLPSIYSNNL